MSEQWQGRERGETVNDWIYELAAAADGIENSELFIDIREYPES
jgi:hypothetical protein